MKIHPKLMWRRVDKQNVVDNVRAQADEAARLAEIPGQDRLTDPRTNPAVRPHAERLRAVQHRRVLDFEHSRKLRKHRVEDRRAHRAEQALKALEDARDLLSPAKSVLALHAGCKRYLRLSLAASLLLAFGSARGLEHVSQAHHLPAGSGYISEVGLTGLATVVILARSDLTRHGGKANGWTDLLLWLLMLVPLTVSMAGNLYGKNITGAVCAAMATAFSLFSYIVADVFAASASEQAKKVTNQDEHELRDVAAGGELFKSAKTPPPRPRHVICTGPTGTVFLRRPKPLRRTASTELAGVAGTRVHEVAELLAGPHAPVVYFIVNGDRVKIGTTQNLRPRVRRLCLRIDDIALVLHGGQAHERSLHERFTDQRVSDSEWFDLAGELAEFVATGGAPVVANSAPPSGDNTPPTGDANKRQDDAPPGDKAAPPTGDNDGRQVAPERRPRPRRAGGKPSRKRGGRRSMTEWVELAGPIFHDQFEELHRQPTGDEFAEAIRKAGLGTVSASTAKNIRTEILDRAPLPSID